MTNPKIKKTRYHKSFPGIARRACRAFNCNDSEIADLFGVNSRTIRRWRIEYDCFAKSLEIGRNEFILKMPRSTVRQIIAEQQKRQRLTLENKRLIKGI